MSLEDYLAVQYQSDETISDLFGSDRTPGEWYFPSYSLDIGPNLPDPEAPYLIWNELDDFVHQAVRETSNSRNRTFTFYVYDKAGDFSRIDAILIRMREISKTMAPFVTEEGVRCSDSLWLGISRPIQREGYDEVARFGTVRFTVSD